MVQKLSMFLMAIIIASTGTAQTQAELSNTLAATQQPLYIVGAGSQTALNQNILLAAAGTAPIDLMTVGAIGYNSVTVAVTSATGTITAGAIIFEESNESTFAVASLVPVCPTASLTGGVGTTFSVVANTTTGYFGNVHMRYFRIRISTAITGTSTGIQCTSFFKGSISNLIGMAVTNNIASASSLGVQVGTGTSNASTSLIVNSNASTNPAAIKGSQTMIYVIWATNTTASAKYLRIYNKTTTPTVGTDVPVYTITIPPTGNYSFASTIGMKLPTGFGYAITGAAGVLDATAVAAGDVQLSINYQ